MQVPKCIGGCCGALFAVSLSAVGETCSDVSTVCNVNVFKSG